MDRAHREGALRTPAGGPARTGPPASLGTVTWLVAVGCAAWTIVLGWDEPHATLLAIPFFLLGVGLVPRHPRTGVALVLAGASVNLLAGAGWGNIDTLVPLALAMFWLGRGTPRGSHDALGILAAALLTAARGGLAPEKLLITAGLFATPWVFGLVVRRRALEAFEALARAEELESEDPEAAAAREAVEERSRLADQALFALRNAIVAMRAGARSAREALEPEAVRAVHERGAAAVEELRALLGLLREVEPAPSAARSPVRPLWRRAATPVACLALAAASLVVSASPPGTPEVLLPGAGAYAAAAWAVSVRPRALAVASFVLLVLSGVWLSLAYGPRGTGFVLVVFGAAVLAGRAWGERDRLRRSARRRELVLQRELDAAVDRAVRAERLRLARELHDVASHAVGAMVLHAGAAAALRDKSPVEARAALNTVEEIARDALREVDEMLAALDAGEFGESSRAYAEPGELRTALLALCERARAHGTPVELELGELPSSPALTATIYRLVHEGLANAERHAPGASVHLVAKRDGTDYRVRMSDDGLGTSSRRGAGFGLEGLRERVAACEGRLDAGPAPGGGFVLEAVLPHEGSSR